MEKRSKEGIWGVPHLMNKKQTKKQKGS
jgi:hypothetical protein